MKMLYFLNKIKSKANTFFNKLNNIFEGNLLFDFIKNIKIEIDDLNIKKRIYVYLNV